MNSERKPWKNLRSKKGCSKLPNIFLQNNSRYPLPDSVLGRIKNLNMVDCEAINKLNFYPGGSHQLNRKEMEQAMMHIKDKKMEGKVMEEYPCSEFTPHSVKVSRSIKEDDR